MASTSKKRSAPVRLVQGAAKGVFNTTLGPAYDVAKRVEEKTLAERDTVLAPESSPLERAAAALKIMAGVPILADTAVGIAKDLGISLIEQGKTAADKFMGVERDEDGNMRVGEAKPLQGATSLIPFVGPAITKATETGDAEDVGQALGESLGLVFGPRVLKRAIPALYEAGKGETGAVTLGKKLTASQKMAELRKQPMGVKASEVIEKATPTPEPVPAGRPRVSETELATRAEAKVAAKEAKLESKRVYGEQSAKFEADRTVKAEAKKSESRSLLAEEMKSLGEWPPAPKGPVGPSSLGLEPTFRDSRLMPAVATAGPKGRNLGTKGEIKSASRKLQNQPPSADPNLGGGPKGATGPDGRSYVPNPWEDKLIGEIERSNSYANKVKAIEDRLPLTDEVVLDPNGQRYSPQDVRRMKASQMAGRDSYGTEPHEPGRSTDLPQVAYDAQGDPHFIDPEPTGMRRGQRVMGEDPSGMSSRDNEASRRGMVKGRVRELRTPPQDLQTALERTYGPNLDKLPGGRTAGDIRPEGGGVPFKTESPKPGEPLKPTVVAVKKTATGKLSFTSKPASTIGPDLKAELVRMAERNVEQGQDFFHAEMEVGQRTSKAGMKKTDSTVVKPPKGEPPLLGGSRGAKNLYEGINPETRSSYEDVFLRGGRTLPTDPPSHRLGMGPSNPLYGEISSRTAELTRGMTSEEHLVGTLGGGLKIKGFPRKLSMDADIRADIQKYKDAVKNSDGPAEAEALKALDSRLMTRSPRNRQQGIDRYPEVRAESDQRRAEQESAGRLKEMLDETDDLALLERHYRNMRDGVTPAEYLLDGLRKYGGKPEGLHKRYTSEPKGDPIAGETGWNVRGRK